MDIPVIAAIRRYVFGFVNSHDFDICRDLMADDYALHMGDTHVVGRDDNYIPAVAHQIKQFPDMGMAIHDVLTDGEHAVLHFSEHGRTVDGDLAAWPGVSIYRLADEKLVECWVEQDHYSRRRQIATRTPVPLLQVATAPFSGHSGTPDLDADMAVRTWLGALEAWPPTECDTDPGPHGADAIRISGVTATPNVVVGEDGRAAFHVTVTGTYDGGLPDTDHAVGRELRLDATGIVTVKKGPVCSGFLVTNRVASKRQMRSR